MHVPSVAWYNVTIPNVANAPSGFKNGIVAENGKVVTDEMIADWESALERDEWPSGWVNVGEIVEGKLPKAAPETVTLSLKVPAAMKRALEKEAKAEGKSTGAYALSLIHI